jgi:hypothetical protein
MPKPIGAAPTMPSCDSGEAAYASCIVLGYLGGTPKAASERERNEADADL